MGHARVDLDGSLSLSNGTRAVGMTNVFRNPTHNTVSEDETMRNGETASFVSTLQGEQQIRWIIGNTCTTIASKQVT